MVSPIGKQPKTPVSMRFATHVGAQTGRERHSLQCLALVEPNKGRWRPKKALWRKGP